jgi:uncharacterized protein YjbI with pentapeptide repeats
MAMSEATFECSKCHAEMFEGAHFCVRCGSPAGATPRAPASLHDALLEIDTNFGALAPPPKPAAASVTVTKQPPSREDDSTRRKQSTMGEFSRDEVLRRARNKLPLKRAGLSGMDLSGANLEGADFGRADLEGANLENAKLRGAILKSANLRQAKLNGADLSQADLDKADLEGASLEGANLEGTNLKRASLEGARLVGARMSTANLSGAELCCAILDGALLKAADLSYAELTEAEMKGADLSGANLSSANLESANLLGANLIGARMIDANLRSATLHGAKLEGALLSGVRAEGALIDWIDLSPAGDGSVRKEGEQALYFLRGEPVPGQVATTRYFGKGDVLRDATLEFGENSVIHIDSRFENCSITLREGAELTIGESGLLKHCSVVGSGKIIVHGRFFERSSPGIVGARSLHVSSRGGLVAGVEQSPDSTVFAFEPGCRLRVKILRPRMAQAAE